MQFTGLKELSKFSCHPLCSWLLDAGGPCKSPGFPGDSEEGVSILSAGSKFLTSPMKNCGPESGKKFACVIQLTSDRTKIGN